MEQEEEVEAAQSSLGGVGLMDLTSGGQTEVNTREPVSNTTVTLYRLHVLFQCRWPNEGCEVVISNADWEKLILTQLWTHEEKNKIFHLAEL